MNCIRVEKPRQFAMSAAKHIYEKYIHAIEQHGCFTFVLSGGNTPQHIFDVLVKDYMAMIDWKKVHVFWLDERCVGFDHDDSNYKLAFDHLLKYMDVGAVYRMEGELEPNDAAMKYENMLTSYFHLKEGGLPVFDLILLGMGEDGHCASIFPGSDEMWEKSRLVVSTQRQYNGYKRISLTLPVINNSGKVLLIGNGVKKSVFMDRDKRLPIHMINTYGLTVIERS